MVDYQKLYMDQLRYCEELSAECSRLRSRVEVLQEQTRNATIRCVALEKRVADLDRRVQGLEEELDRAYGPNAH